MHSLYIIYDYFNIFYHYFVHLIALDFLKTEINMLFWGFLDTMDISRTR